MAAFYRLRLVGRREHGRSGSNIDQLQERGTSLSRYWADRAHSHPSLPPEGCARKRGKRPG